MRCRKGQCDQPAVFAVCLLLKKPGEIRQLEAVHCVTELNVCAQHGAEIDGGDPFALEVLNDEAWKDIVLGFINAGRRPPLRDWCKVTIKELDDPLVTGFREQM